MSEASGGGRVDRIEANLERATQRINDLTERFREMLEHHDEEFKKLMTWQVLMQNKFEKAQAEAEHGRKRLDTLSETTDKRIVELVSGIRSLIERLPLQKE
jgi:predicted  nucleic acid-binding Zn-ribbon protein